MGKSDCRTYGECSMSNCATAARLCLWRAPRIRCVSVWCRIGKTDGAMHTHAACREHMRRIRSGGEGARERESEREDAIRCGSHVNRKERSRCDDMRQARYTCIRRRPYTLVINARFTQSTRTELFSVCIRSPHGVASTSTSMYIEFNPSSGRSRPNASNWQSYGGEFSARSTESWWLVSVWWRHRRRLTGIRVDSRSHIFGNKMIVACMREKQIHWPMPWHGARSTGMCRMCSWQRRHSQRHCHDGRYGTFDR